MTRSASTSLKTPVVSGNSITLSWNAAEGADRYTISYNENGESGKKINGIKTTSYTLTGLSYDMTYNFWISALNKNGVGYTSKKEVSATTEPAFTLELVGDPAIAVGESRQIRVHLAPEYETSDITWDVSETSIQIDQNGIVTAVEGSTDNVTVFAETSNGLTAEIDVYPYVPLTSMRFEQNTYTVVNGKSYDNISVVYNNAPQVLPAESFLDGLALTSSDETVASILSFTNNRKVKVKANSVGTATITVTASNGVSASCVVNVIPDQLEPPVIEKISNQSDGLRIQWSQVESEHADNLNDVSYNIYWCLEANASDLSKFKLKETKTVSNNANTIRYTFTNFNSGKTYCFYLEAFKDGYISSCSAIYTATYTSTSSSETTPTALNAPTNVTAESLAGNHVRLKWSPVSGASAYTIYWSEDNPNSLTNKTGTYFNSSDGSYCYNDFSNMSADHTYYFSVCANSGKNSSARSPVVSSVAGNITPVSVSLNKTSVSMTPGEKLQLIPNVLPAAANTTYTWSSNTTSVADVSPAGLVSAVGVGTATITVKTDEGNKTATCVVQVGAVKRDITSVTVTPATLTLSVGNTATLSTTLLPVNYDVSVTTTWSSSNSAVATVNSSGKVTAVAAGNAVITATVRSSEGTSKASTCSVTVNPAEVPATGISLNKSSITLEVGGTTTLTATVTPNNATNKSVTWSSSNTSVAKVNSYGTVTGIANGTATITAKTVAGNYTATCQVTVQNILVESIIVKLDGQVVNETSVTLMPYETRSFSVEVSPSNAGNKEVRYLTTENTVVVIDNDMITAGRAGTVLITVEAKDGSGVKTAFIITVEPQLVIKDVITGSIITDESLKLPSDTAAGATRELTVISNGQWTHVTDSSYGTPATWLSWSTISGGMGTTTLTLTINSIPAAGVTYRAETAFEIIKIGSSVPDIRKITIEMTGRK